MAAPIPVPQPDSLPEAKNTAVREALRLIRNVCASQSNVLAQCLTELGSTVRYFPDSESDLEDWPTNNRVKLDDLLRVFHIKNLTKREELGEVLSLLLEEAEHLLNKKTFRSLRDCLFSGY